MATILVIFLTVSSPNFVHFRTVNAQKPSPKGEAAAWSAYSWIRACSTSPVLQSSHLTQVCSNTAMSSTANRKQPAVLRMYESV